MKTLTLILALVFSTGVAFAAHDDMEFSIYCNTETNWVPALTNVALVKCPNNAAHSVKSNSVRVVNSNPHGIVRATTTNATVGTPGEPFQELYCESNSVHIGDEVLSQADVTLSKEKLRYVSRGDLGSWDFVKPDFTQDDNWNSLSLTNEVPSGAVTAYIRLNLEAGGAAMTAKFREDGVTGGVNSRQPVTENGVNTFPDFMIDVSSNRVIEYNFSAGTWSSLKMAVLGYYTAD